MIFRLKPPEPGPRLHKQETKTSYSNAEDFGVVEPEYAFS
jgi:hypothetical protein